MKRNENSMRTVSVGTISFFGSDEQESKLVFTTPLVENVGRRVTVKKGQDIDAPKLNLSENETIMFINATEKPIKAVLHGERTLVLDVGASNLVFFLTEPPLGIEPNKEMVIEPFCSIRLRGWIWLANAY